MERRCASKGYFFSSPMSLEMLLYGALMGIAFAAPPGVVTTETLRRGLRGGFRQALSVQLGSLIGDAGYASIALAGIAAFLQSPLAQMIAGGVGALFLIYLSWQSLRSAGNDRGAMERPGRLREAFLSGMMLSLTNPWAIAFWISLGGSFVALGLARAADLPWLFVSFMGGAVAWALVLAGLIDRGRRFLSPSLFRAISIACGLLLAVFGLSTGVRVLSMLFG